MYFLRFLLLIITFTACQSEAEKKVERVTNDYVRFVDSVTNKGAVDVRTNWNQIEKAFDKKTTELNIKIDNLEDNTALGAKMDSATRKYEAFRKTIFGRAMNPDAAPFIE